MTPCFVLVYIIILLLCGLLALVSYWSGLHEAGQISQPGISGHIERLTSWWNLGWLQPASGRSGHCRTGAVVYRRHYLLIGYLVFQDQKWTGPEIAPGGGRHHSCRDCLQPLASLCQFTRTRAKAGCVRSCCLKLLIYAMLPVTIVLGFGLSVAALAEPHEPEVTEHPTEAVDALL